MFGQSGQKILTLLTSRSSLLRPLMCSDSFVCNSISVHYVVPPLEFFCFLPSLLYDYHSNYHYYYYIIIIIKNVFFFCLFRTKSRSVDQSLAAAFDVDVIGGLSRLAGSALGSSTGKFKYNFLPC
jgi:hypothetical protein